MNSRERLLTTLLHEPADRVPISTYEMVGWNPDAWENHQPAYRHLMDLIRQKTDCLYLCGFPSANALQRLTVTEWDEGASHYTREVLHTPHGDLTMTTRQDAGLNTVWALSHLLKDDEDIKRFLSQPIEPVPPDISGFAGVQTRLGDHGIPLVDIADPLCVVAELFDFSDFMVRAFSQPEQIEALLEHVAPSIYASARYLLEHGLGPLFRVVGAEYATPPYLPPALFERYEVRYTEPIIRMIHDHQCTARLHCHGRIRQALPMIVEMGCDALDPVEAPPSGDITLGEVKQLYGDKLCLMGNLQLRDLETLPTDRLREVVRETVEAGKPGGGFVIMSTASPINADLSPLTERNYEAFIETALEYGGY